MALTTADSPPSSPWSTSLPVKLASALLRRLPSHIDRVRFGAVCRRWRAAVGPGPRRTLPWLALPDGAFFSFPSSAALRSFFPDAAAGYHGSYDDFLLFVNDSGDGGGDGSYLLANPFTGDTIQLPGLTRVRLAVGDGRPALSWRGVADDWRAPHGATVRKVVVCPGGKVVAAMVGDGKLGKIAMCRHGVSSSGWVMSGHDAWRRITDIAFYDGKVYAVEDDGNLLAMPTCEDRRTGEPQVAWAKVVIKVSDDTPARRRRRGKAPPASMRYLLVSGGRLMMVYRTAMDDGTTKFTVFKADLVSSEWSEMRSIGEDTALFVGRWSSLAMRVSSYKLPGNRVHFLDDDVFRDSFGSYDMADGKTYLSFRRWSIPMAPGARRGHGTSLGMEQEGVLGWRDLPSDVFGLVVRRLHRREDRVHLSEVCRVWLATTRQSLRWRPRQVPPPPVRAATLTRTTAAPPVHTATMAYLALPNRTVFRYPELTSRPFHNNAAGIYLAAACDDWLVFHDADGLFRMTSPFTGKTRLLPSFHNVHVDDRPVEIVNEPAPSQEAVTTAGLWRDDDTMAVRKLVVCPDGFIAAIFGREHFAKVAICSLETFSWSHSKHDRWRRYDDLAFHGGRLYAITARGDLLAMDVGVDGETGHPSVSRVERVIAGAMPAAVSSFHYLVPSGWGELLMVRRRFARAVEPLAVFRADLEAGRWEEVSYLGYDGEALFVGRMCSRVVRARHLRGDQVFFLPDDCAGMWSWEPRRRGDHHAAVYDMWSGTVTGILPRQLQEDDDDGASMVTWLFTTEPRWK